MGNLEKTPVIGLTLQSPPRGAPLRVLCLGAHSDDIEIGCGGTVLKLVRDHPDIEWHWIVFSSSGQRAGESRASADAFLAGAQRPTIRVLRFRESFFPVEWATIKRRFERLKTEVEPDLIVTHCRDDRHQDHRVLHDLTWNTFRSHFILEYEIPKYDGDFGQPNVFVELDHDLARKKTDLLLRHFKTQRSKHWFSQDLFLGLMRLRGMEAAASTGYAEAFCGRKIRLR